MRTVIKAVTRRRSTTNGNPRWLVELADGRVFPTDNESQVGFVLDEGWAGRMVDLTIADGAVCGVQVVE